MRYSFNPLEVNILESYLEAISYKFNKYDSVKSANFLFVRKE